MHAAVGQILGKKIQRDKKKNTHTQKTSTTTFDECGQK